MKLGIAQLGAAVTIIVLAMLTQLVPSIDLVVGNRRPGPSEPTFGAYSSALAQDDNDEDDNEDDEDNDEDNNDDEDNDDEDNDDEDNDDEDNDDEDNDDDADNDDDNEDNEDEDSDNDEDNEDEDTDNEDEDADNGEADNDGDDVDSGGGASFTFDASVTEASGTSTGGDSRIGLPADRILVQVFPWMPQGVLLTIRLLDPSFASTPPCTVVGDLLFQLEAHDSGGAVLSQLPAEVNLSARYTNQQVSGLSRQDATLVWLDPTDSQWRTAPKLVTSPSTNYVAASVTAPGAYAVCVR